MIVEVKSVSPGQPVNGNPGIVPPWLQGNGNGGIVPPWLVDPDTPHILSEYLKVHEDYAVPADCGRQLIEELMKSQ